MRNIQFLDTLIDYFSEKNKGVWHMIFAFRFFPWISVPKPLIIPLGPFQIFSKILGDIPKLMFIHGVNGIFSDRRCRWYRRKIYYFSSSVGHSDDNIFLFFFKAISLVSRTRTPWRWGAVKERRMLKGTKRWYLRPPMVSLEPPWKGASVDTSRILMRAPWGC